MILISGSKSESEEAAAAEDIANSLYDQENFSLQVPVCEILPWKRMSDKHMV